MYGLKGVGALMIREDIPCEPLINGGGQQRGRRSATENISGIVGLGEAARIVHQELEEESARLSQLHDHLIESIKAQGLARQMNVVRDVLTAMGVGGVTAMHDATELGLTHFPQ